VQRDWAWGNVEFVFFTWHLIVYSIPGGKKKFVRTRHRWMNNMNMELNLLNPELNPICYLLALLAHHFLHVSRIRVQSLTLRLLMSYIYIYIYIYDFSSLRVKPFFYYVSYFFNLAFSILVFLYSFLLPFLCTILFSPMFLWK